MPLQHDSSERELLWIEPNKILGDIVECKGEWFQNTFEKLRAIISYQLDNQEVKGIKGFILYGEVGTGKTLMAKVLAKSLHLPLLFVDGTTIARSLYGQSEQQISKVFESALKRKSIVLIDDAESVFPDREWEKGESWYMAQNNIFFHQLDNMDTSKTIIIMTTNKYNLLDKALKDRLYPVEFPELDEKTMLEIVETKCMEKGMEDGWVIKEIKKNPENFKSVRAIEKLIIDKYVEKISGVTGTGTLE